MNKNENQNKETEKEKSEKIKKTKIIKKKIKRNITNGIAYVNATFNNTIITIADDSGNVIAWSSAGQKVLKVLENLHHTQLKLQLIMLQEKLRNMV